MRRAHIGDRPVGLAVGPDRGERAHEGAVGVGGAGADVALVEVGVHVDEARQAPWRGPCRRRGLRRLPK